MEAGLSRVSSWPALLRRTCRRRRVLVEGFQVPFVLAQMAWLGLLVLLISACLFAPAVITLLGPEAAAREEVAGDFLLMHRLVWPLVGTFCLTATLVTVLLTHRVAGPLHRFRRVFIDVGRGVLTMRVTLRQGDYLRAEAADLDRMVSTLRDRVGAAKEELALARHVVARLTDSGRPSTSDDLSRLDDRLAGAAAALEPFETERPPAVAPVSAPTDAALPTSDSAPRGPQNGFTLVEILLVTCIITVLASIAMPAYSRALHLARVTKAIADLRSVDRLVRLHVIKNSCMPSSLADIGFSDVKDPWGQPYVYGVIGSPGGGGGGGRGGGGGGGGGSSCVACSGGCITQGAARKDKKLVPINFDFDVYSVGPDGQSSPPLGAKNSEDDVVRGAGGGFFGLAKDY